MPAEDFVFLTVHSSSLWYWQTMHFQPNVAITYPFCSGVIMMLAFKRWYILWAITTISIFDLVGKQVILL